MPNTKQIVFPDETKCLLASSKDGAWRGNGAAVGQLRYTKQLAMMSSQRLDDAGPYRWRYTRV